MVALATINWENINANVFKDLMDRGARTTWTSASQIHVSMGVFVKIRRAILNASVLPATRDPPAKWTLTSATPSILAFMVELAGTRWVCSSASACLAMKATDVKLTLTNVNLPTLVTIMESVRTWSMASDATVRAQVLRGTCVRPILTIVLPIPVLATEL